MGYRHNQSSIIMQSSRFVKPVPNDGVILPKLFWNILAQPTPHGKENLIHKFLPFMAPDSNYDVEIDKLGNIFVRIGKVKTDYRTMFSCHLDTVHAAASEEPISLFITDTQDLDLDPNDSSYPKVKDIEEGMIYAGKYYTAKEGDNRVAPSVLGADDKVGIYILCKMIEAKIPGLYAFHVGEERGCIGSKHVAANTPDVVKGIRRCIAFDRRNYTDVIAFQNSDRKCSTAFSTALAEGLNKNINAAFAKYKPDIQGLYTDSASYSKIISECVNLSVGYHDPHGTDEHFDNVWLEDLFLPAALKVDWEKLPTERDKSKETVAYTGHWPGYTHNNGTNYTTRNVKWEDATEATGTWNLKPYRISFGYIPGLKPGVMEKLVDSAIIWETKSNNISDIYNLLIRDHNNRLIIKGLRDFLRKAANQDDIIRGKRIIHRVRLTEQFNDAWVLADKKALTTAEINDVTESFRLMKMASVNTLVNLVNKTVAKELNIKIVDCLISTYDMTRLSPEFKKQWHNIQTHAMGCKEEEGFSGLIQLIHVDKDCTPIIRNVQGKLPLVIEKK